MGRWKQNHDRLWSAINKAFIKRLGLGLLVKVLDPSLRPWTNNIGLGPLNKALALSRKKICNAIVIFCWQCCVSLVKFSCWFKFHVNIITDSGVGTIFVYKGLARNTEIGNTPMTVLPNIWRLGQVKDTKFGTNVSNEKLLKALKCKDYSFYCFWVIQGKPTRGGKITPNQISVHGGIKLALTSFYYVSREIWLGNSKKVICIDQSRFYIFPHTQEFKNDWHNFKIF